jgi:thioredoxin-related protein
VAHQCKAKGVAMKYILLLILLLNGLFASSSEFIEKMNYETIYEKALERAIKENKSIMMIASTKSCPWCRKLERQTLTRDNINNIIQKNFVPLAVDQDLKNYPKKYEVKVVPTVYFINPKDESVIKKVLGYKNKKEFSKILDEVVSK